MTALTNFLISPKGGYTVIGSYGTATVLQANLNGT